jgi:hypothetical protein
MLTDTIKQFINRQIELHPQLAPWLADWEPGWETQIMADVDGLEPCYGDGLNEPPTHWIDGEGYEHRHIRIPHNAWREPHWHDRPVYGPVHQRWVLLGNTGWHWQERKSMHVGFDFDSIANHKKGLDPAKLQEILGRALDLPYVVARTSKSGQGVHVLVPLSPWVTTRNHREHAQLARHVLGRMSRDCGFDFVSVADPNGIGGNLWSLFRGVREDGLRIINKWTLG